MLELADSVQRFYAILDDLDQRIGKRLLRDCDGRMLWPSRGVYFFFEDGELRKTGTSHRVVRVGTHAIIAKSQTTLWSRLSQHKGTRSGSGNHRGSIFRLHVGAAMLNRHDPFHPKPTTWGVGSSAPKRVRDAEQQVERAVSEHIRAMPFLWLNADDEPGRGSIRSIIERNVIPLLSQWNRDGKAPDSPSPSWLGRFCPRDAVRNTGLWNIRHTGDDYDSSFLDVFERCASGTHAG